MKTKPKHSMSETTDKKQPKNVAVVREGNKIIIPDGMSYKDARTWITRQEESEETLVNISFFVDCFPLDGMVALGRAFEEIYGFTDIRSVPGFWGPEPPTLFQVSTPKGQITAPYGKLAPPKWEGGSLMADFSGPRVNITGQVKKKFEAEVKSVCELTQKMLKEKSIYRGEAFQIDLSWMADERKFHPIKDAPKFFDVGMADLILNPKTEFELATSVFMILERSEACRKNKINLKHGAIFKGPFGTGKTLCARVLAEKATKNGWTFIYLKAADQLANGLRIAKMYSPCVVFAEDIDTVVSERDDEMNNLLNVLDGVDTKTEPIMVILTTNKEEDIDPSFLRAGRIDSVIHFGPPDPETVVKFLNYFGKGMIAPEQDLIKVGQELAGLVPAFVYEAINKAKRYAIYRTGKEKIDEDITADDLLQAAKSVKDHIELMKKKGMTDPEKIAAAIRTVHTYGINGTVLSNEQIAEELVGSND